MTHENDSIRWIDIGICGRGQKGRVLKRRNPIDTWATVENITLRYQPKFPLGADATATTVPAT